MIDRAKRVIQAVDRWTLRYRSTRVARRAVEGFLRHEGLQYAGSMAYFAVLSLFQLLVLAVVVLTFIIGEGPAREFVIERVVQGTPLDAETVAAVIDGAIESRGSMTVVSFAFLIWAALGIFSALSNGIGRVFERTPPRGFIQQQMLGLALMGLTGILVLASFAVGILTGILQRAADDFLVDLPIGELGLQLIGLFVPLILIFVALWCIYRIVPNRPVRWMEVLPGAIVAALLWTVLRFGFTWYATSIARYDSAFGPLSAGITLLVFLYFASVVILIGAELARANSLERAPEARPDALPGPILTHEPPPNRRPPGKLRGAAGLVGAAIVGIVIGRFTKRDDY